MRYEDKLKFAIHAAHSVPYCVPCDALVGQDFNNANDAASVGIGLMKVDGVLIVQEILRGGPADRCQATAVLRRIYSLLSFPCAISSYFAKLHVIFTGVVWFLSETSYTRLTTKKLRV